MSILPERYILLVEWLDDDTQPIEARYVESFNDYLEQRAQLLICNTEVVLSLYRIADLEAREVFHSEPDRM